MKKLLLMSLALIVGLAVVAQRPQIKKGVFVKNVQKEQKIAFEPFEKLTPSMVTKKRTVKHNDNPNIVTVIDLGTSANVLGYSSGSRTMVWADDDLNAVINFHRAGPGSTPPSLSGYYAMDLGTNMGMTESDWNSQIIVSNATLVSSPYYYDASRYPSAGIYNPAGNTNLANAYCTFFGPNFANLVVSGFGGYTYGRANLVNFTDTTKNLYWYDPTPYTYIPAGFTISTTGIVHVVDGDQNVESGSVVYQDSVIYWRGVWNSTSMDFEYTPTVIPMQCKEMYGEADEEIAASPDGNTVWLSVLTNYVNGQPLLDSVYYPLVRKSTDGGLTWGDPIPVILDGPNGIDGVKMAYSTFFIENFFVGPPFPTRDEIPYTTAFDHGLSVDKWGNPHIAVAIGYAPGGYSISTGVDSLINVFDVYSLDDGLTWNAVKMGSLKTFRGTWATYTSDNRVYIARDKAGERMFVTWNDTRIDGETNNQNPDVYARGWNLLTNKLTSDNGTDGPNNVTFLCDITQEAYFQCTSPYVFTDNNKFTIPVVVQWFSDGAGASQFKYIPDFSYTDADFTIQNAYPGPNVGIGEKNAAVATVNVYPNPVKDAAKVAVTLTKNANLTIDVTNIVGQQVLSLNKGNVAAGTQTYTINASGFNSGIYFVTVNVDGQKVTQKMIVE